MVTIYIYIYGNHKPNIYNRLIIAKKRKETKHNIKDSHQVTREKNKRRKEKKNYKKTSKAIIKCN